MTKPLPNPLILHGLLLGAFFQWGVASANAEVYSWAQCIDLVSKNNADLQTAEANLKATEEQEGVSRAGFLPQVSANLAYTKGNTTTNIDFSQTNNVGSFSANSNNYTANLSGSWNLFSGFQNLGQFKQAKANTEAQRAALQISKAQISYDLKTSFQGLFYANEYAKLTKEIIKRREENMRLVELRFQSGLENKGSVLLSQANTEQAKLDDIQAENAKRIARAQLARSLGLDEFSEFDISGEIPVLNEKTTRPDLKDLAIRTPDVSQAIAREEAAYQGITQARSNFFPSLDLTGSVGRQGPSFFPDQRNSWSVGLNLSFPLFNGGKDYYGIKSAASTWAAASSTHENTNRQILAKLEQVYASYIEGIAKLKVDQAYRDATTVRAEISRKRYNNGLITFDDWNIIEDDLISRQKAYLQSKRDRVITEAAYEQAQGKGVLQ
jgi:outer membrane protein